MAGKLKQAISGKVCHILTWVKLLKSADDTTIMSALSIIKHYLLREKSKGYVFLNKHGLMENLIPLLSFSVYIARQTLTIMVNLTLNKNFHKRYSKDEDFLNELSELFLTTLDDDLLLYSSHFIMNYFCTNYGQMLLWRPLFIKKVFYIITSSKNHTVIVNCITILDKMMNWENHQECILNNIEHIEIEVLLALLKIAKFRPLILRILKSIIYIRDEYIHEKLYDLRIVPRLIKCLEEKEWTNRQNQLILDIDTCCRIVSCEIQAVESKEFHQFLKYCGKATPTHIFSAVQLIRYFIQNAQAFRSMYDFRIPKLMEKFLKIKCNETRQDICEVYSKFCEEPDMMRSVYSVNLVKLFVDMMNNTSANWEYRLIPIRMLYLFLTSDESLAFAFFKHGVLGSLRQFYLNRSKVTEDSYSMIIEMFIVFGHNKKVLPRLFNRDSYIIFAKLIEEDNISVVLNVFRIVEDSLTINKYRQWFSEINVLKDIHTQFPHFETLAILSIVIKFLYDICNDKSMAIRIREAGFVPTLKKLTTTFRDSSGYCTKIVQVILEHDLSYKFFITGYLAPTEKIDNGFYTYLGYRPIEFLASCKLRCPADISKYNVYVVVDCMKPARLSEKKMLKLLKVDFSSSTSMANKRHFKKSDTKIKAKYVKYDRLKRFYEKTCRKLKEMSMRSEKVRFLASFVFREFRPIMKKSKLTAQAKHDYFSRMFDLQMKIGCNCLPMSTIKIGSIVEKAVFFKMLADISNIPCSLRRNDSTIWNEVPIPDLTENNTTITTMCIVDLVDLPGRLFAVSSKEAELYRARKYMCAAINE